MHLLLYALGRALKDKELALLAFSIQADHYHVVVVDLSQPGEPSDLPKFFAHFNSMAARGLNQHLGRMESVWSEGSYFDKELWGPDSLLLQLLYAWIQPVKDGQARSPDDWPGFAWKDPKTGAEVSFLPEGLGTTLTVSRPEFACYGGRRSPHRPPTDPIARERWERLRRQEEEGFRALFAAGLRQEAQSRRAKRRRNKAVKPLTRARQEELLEQRMQRWRRKHRPRYTPRPSRSQLPETVEIQIGVPPGYEGKSLGEIRAELRERLDEHVRETLARRAERGLPAFRGDAKARVEGTDPFGSAGPVWPNPRRRQRLDTRGMTEEGAGEVVDGWWAFRREYKASRLARLRDEPNVSFPLGTYDLLANHGVRIAGAPP